MLAIFMPFGRLRAKLIVDRYLQAIFLNAVLVPGACLRRPRDVQLGQHRQIAVSIKIGSTVPGVFSALGDLVADLRVEHQSFVVRACILDCAWFADTI